MLGFISLKQSFLGFISLKQSFLGFIILEQFPQANDPAAEFPRVYQLFFVKEENVIYLPLCAEFRMSYILNELLK